MNVIRKSKFTSFAHIRGLRRGETYDIVEAYGGEYIGVINDFGEKVMALDYWFD